MFVVWEPVLPTDVVGPSSRTLARIDDPRAAQYWDPELAVSTDLVRGVNADPSRFGLEEPFPEDHVAWDLIVVFERGARWDATLPVAVFHGFPVVESIDDAREAIRRSLP